MGAGASVLLGACTEQPVPAVPNPGGGEGRLAKASDVPVGGGVITEDGVMVMQLSEGRFSAMAGICTHQNFRLTPPDKEGVINCAAHLSRFRAADGARIEGPAPEGLKPVPVRVQDGYIVKITM